MVIQGDFHRVIAGNELSSFAVFVGIARGLLSVDKQNSNVDKAVPRDAKRIRRGKTLSFRCQKINICLLYFRKG